MPHGGAQNLAAAGSLVELQDRDDRDPGHASRQGRFRVVTLEPKPTCFAIGKINTEKAHDHG